jgi:hypothetical protein
MKTRSAKAKGRRLQNEVCQMLLEHFKEKLQEGDLRPALMGESGEDIKRSPLAKRLLPFSFECKNQEKLNIWSALEQAAHNSGDGDSAVVVFKRNRSNTYVALDFEVFMNLLGNAK